MTARDELTNRLIEQWQIVLPENFLDALTPDLWLRYGLEMGWLEDSGRRYEQEGDREEPTGVLYRLPAGAEEKVRRGI